MVGAIPGAKLLLRGASEYIFETGSDGSYTVTGLPEGQYSIEVLKPGYARLAIGQRKVKPAKPRGRISTSNSAAFERR